MSRGTLATIDLAALQNNLARVKTLAPNSRVMAIVKADAYGHDVDIIAPTLNAADALGVSHIDEALELRDMGIQKDIVLLEGVFDSKELSTALSAGFQLVIHQIEQLEMLEKVSWSDKGASSLPIWLKVNTGMNRLGVPLQRMAECFRRLDVLKQRMAGQLQVSLMSHFSSADETDGEAHLQQWNRCRSIVDSFRGQKSLANSAAILNLPESHLDWVRPGLMLYGASPLAESPARQLGLMPVMALHSKIIAIQQLGPGDAVGYNATWTAKSPSRIAIVAIGYGDGYPRHVDGTTQVSVAGQRCHLVGRVSMDMIAVDISAVESARIGMAVELWGAEIPVDEVAKSAGTTSYELLCQVTPRVKRVALPAQGEQTEPNQTDNAGSESSQIASQPTAKMS